MKYSFLWLKELSGTKKSPEKVVEDLTFHSLEVESLEKHGKDSIIDIKVLPDRAHDAMSHVGVAREIAVLEKKKLDYDFNGLKLTKIKSNDLKVKIIDVKLCPRYIGAVITGIQVKDSPDWIKKRLEASGIRAINNVVDATNYVMLELGQPLHAFDADKLAAVNSQLATKVREIVVRKAKNGEIIELLDGDTKRLSSDDLLITDGDHPLAIAGIKGGKLAEINKNTKIVLLEAANFNAVNIRKTRTRLNLKTDSSDRFEKDIDPDLAERAMVRLIEIIEHIANGKLENINDIYPKPVKPWKIKLDLKYVNKLLGELIPVKKIIKILNLLEIKTKSGKVIECTIPTFRVDLKTQEDLIEEIGRIWGYEKIKEQPIISAVAPAKINEQVYFERKIQDILTGLGFDEVYNYSFYGENDADKCGLGNAKHLELSNPMNPDQKYVRISLIPNILKNIYENLKYFENIRIFEEGRVYLLKNNKFPEEKRMLVIAEVLENNNNSKTFYSLKGLVESLLSAIGIKEQSISFLNSDLLKIWHPARSAAIMINNDRVGIIGEVNPYVLSQYKITKRVTMAQFDLEILRKLASAEKIYKPIGKYPTVKRDISLLASEDLIVAEIINLIKKAGENLILKVKLFDIFQKEEKNSFTFHIEFGLKNRTLESKEVDNTMENIISTLESELKVKVRK